MTPNDFPKIELSENAITALVEMGKVLKQTFGNITVSMTKVKFNSFPFTSPVESAQESYERELALRRDEATSLTRAARAYGYRDAKVMWLTAHAHFVLIQDGPVCEDIPIIGEDYESALRWIRLEAAQ